MKTGKWKSWRNDCDVKRSATYPFGKNFTLTAILTKSKKRICRIKHYDDDGKMDHTYDLACMHTKLMETSEEYLNMQLNNRPQQINDEFQSLMTISEEDVELSFDDDFFALDSWVQAISNQGIDILLNDSYSSNTSIPFIHLFIGILISADLRYMDDICKLIQSKCRFENDWHMPSLIQNMAYVTDAIAIQKKADRKYDLFKTLLSYNFPTDAFKESTDALVNIFENVKIETEFHGHPIWNELMLRSYYQTPLVTVKNAPWSSGCKTVRQKLKSLYKIDGSVVYIIACAIPFFFVMSVFAITVSILDNTISENSDVIAAFSIFFIFFIVILFLFLQICRIDRIKTWINTMPMTSMVDRETRTYYWIGAFFKAFGGVLYIDGKAVPVTVYKYMFFDMGFFRTKYVCRYVLYQRPPTYIEHDNALLFLGKYVTIGDFSDWLSLLSGDAIGAAPKECKLELPPDIVLEKKQLSFIFTE